MGNNSSKSSKSNSKNNSPKKPVRDELVDLGAVFPNGLYPSTEQDYDTRILRDLIKGRKVAPFYRGLPDAPETVTIPPPVPTASSSVSTAASSPKVIGRPRSSSTTTKKDPSYDPYLERKKAHQEKMKQREKMLYNDAVECPICFLYYPSNINYSRCCDQPICTECFVQIHRPIESPSTPATCPFCMQENYGILYETPAWSDKFQARSRSGSHSTISGTRHTTSGSGGTEGPRRESVSHDDPDVVLVGNHHKFLGDKIYNNPLSPDRIRPNWNNTAPPSSNINLSRRNSASAGNRSRNNNLLRAAGVSSLLTRPGRSASSAAATEYNLTNIRNGNDMDIEDWMVMEAIRLSLAEQEEFDRKQAIEKSKQESSTAEASTSAILEEENPDLEIADGESSNHHQDDKEQQTSDTPSTSV